MKKKNSDDSSDPLPKQWVGCDVEANYFGDRRKEGKEERKRASAKDRSQYKKTDLKKKHKIAEAVPEVEMEEGSSIGRVMSIASQGVLVMNETGEILVCSLKGALKKETQLFKNLVTVGDEVVFSVISKGEGIIARIQPRRSILSRADNLSRRKQQLIAANVDQVLITVSLVSPTVKPSLIDRYIIAAQKGGLTPVVIVNKIDLLDDPTQDPIVREVEKEIFEEMQRAYAVLKIPCLGVSVSQKTGLEELQELMKGKVSVFSGQSGVGKSSLITALTGKDIKTGEIVGRTGKGSHTTTTTQLLPLLGGGWCIDTPGIKSFGIWDLKKDELESQFDEIHQIGLDCKFGSCTHRQEEGCAVLQALEDGTLSMLRYESYCILLAGLEEDHLRR